MTVILPVHKEFLRKRNETNEVKKTRHDAASIERLILDKLKEKGAMSTISLARNIGYANVNSTFARVVKGLVSSRKIEYTEPDKPNSRNQKLRITKQ